MTELLYDTHAHLDDSRLIDQVEAVLERAGQAGVGWINTVGCNWPSSQKAVELARRYPAQLRAVIGIHPEDGASVSQTLLGRLAELSEDPGVVAIGEIGLDYHYPDGTSREVQQYAFTAQIDLARQLRLPIMIHNRDSHQDMMDIIRREQAGQNGGVLHCFSGSWEMAKECLRQGFYLSFGGPLTYPNSRTAVEVATKAPLDRLLVETDCPYLSPHPYRGKTNEPARVIYTATRLAELRGLDFERVAEQTTANAQALFGSWGQATASSLR